MATTNDILQEACKRAQKAPSGDQQRLDHNAMKGAWGALTAWVSEQLHAGRGASIPQFARLTWLQATSARAPAPAFVFTDSFLRANHIAPGPGVTLWAAASQKQHPCEELNCSKLAIRYAGSMSKDTLAAAIRHIMATLSEAAASGLPLSLDLQVGTLQIRGRHATFAFTNSLLRSAPATSSTTTKLSATSALGATASGPQTASSTAACYGQPVGAPQHDALSVHLQKLQMAEPQPTRPPSRGSGTLVFQPAIGAKTPGGGSLASVRMGSRDPAGAAGGGRHRAGASGLGAQERLEGSDVLLTAAEPLRERKDGGVAPGAASVSGQSQGGRCTGTLKAQLTVPCWQPLPESPSSTARKPAGPAPAAPPILYALGPTDPWEGQKGKATKLDERVQAPALSAAEERIRNAKERAEAQDQRLEKQQDRRRKRLDRRAEESVHKKREEAQQLQAYWREQMETRQQKSQREQQEQREGMPQLPAWRSETIESPGEKDARRQKTVQYRHQLEHQMALKQTMKQQQSEGVMAQELHQLQEVEEDLLRFKQEQRQHTIRQQQELKEDLDTQMVLQRMQRTAAAAASSGRGVVPAASTAR